jgi:hypothetical protein
MAHRAACRAEPSADKLPADSPARAAVQAVIALPDATLEQQADRLLAGITLGLDLAAAPLVAAGCSCTGRMAAATAAAHPKAFDAPPTATLPLLRQPAHGQHHRSGQGRRPALPALLCVPQWHMEMVQCSHCGTHKGIRYQALQAADGGHTRRRRSRDLRGLPHYLKIVHQERDRMSSPWPTTWPPDAGPAGVRGRLPAPRHQPAAAVWRRRTRYAGACLMPRPEESVVHGSQAASAQA